MLSKPKPFLCLAVMVKNEQEVIGRCIASAAPYVDEVFVLDTGSTDNTVSAVYGVCESLDLPVTVASAEWTNFGEMRSLLMASVRRSSSSVWTLQVDADWVLEVDDPSTNPFDFLVDRDEVDAHNLTIFDTGLSWELPMVTRNSHNWRYEGPVHEFLTDDGAGGRIVRAGVPGTRAVHHNDGSNRDGRHARDADLLRGRTDPRSQFYYAQSLNSIGQYAKAVDAYLVRADNTEGWDEEVYWSLYQAGKCAHLLGPGSIDQAVGLLIRAWGTKTHRIEALCTIAEIYRGARNWTLAYYFAGQAVEIARVSPPPENSLFVEKWRWQWGAQWEFLAGMSVLGDKKEALAGWYQLLESSGGDMPENYVMAAEKNINWLDGSLDRTGPTHRETPQDHVSSSGDIHLDGGSSGEDKTVPSTQHGSTPMVRTDFPTHSV